MIIAIDGPGGSGKSTVARALAARLGYHYLDTGAMYRAVAVAALRDGVPLDDDGALGELARRSAIEFAHDEGSALPTRVLLDGADVTLAIRTPEADTAVSPVSAVPEVRDAMVALQREIGARGDIVAEGRDLGTVVFPQAELKVYLTASAEERARRRHLEMVERGETLEAEAVLDRLNARDTYDSTRAASPLAAADDAVLVDTTELAIDEVVERIAQLAEERE